MRTVHFKRRGFANCLELRGLPREDSPHCYTYIELNRNGDIDFLKMEHVCSGRVWASKTVEGRYGSEKTHRLIWKKIEKAIGNFIGEEVCLEKYIESYHWGYTDYDKQLHPDDRHMLQLKNGNWIDITDMSTEMVTPLLDTESLSEYFKGWNVQRFPNVVEILDHPPQKMLDMKFVDLYSLIHNGHYKKDFEQEFMEATKS